MIESRKAKPLNYTTRAILVAIWLLMVRPVSADGPPQEGRTAALIDVNDTPLAALLEAKLLDSSHLRLLDRASIDRVLKEQQLANVFGAEYVGDRVRLGKLLKADILVLLRRSDDPDSTHEVVVCETQSGLRLFNHRFKASVDLNAEASSLAKLVIENCEKWPAEVKTIVAVPPFLSDDLEHTYDSAKRAYARLLEENLSQRSSTLVVEVAEARAITKEFVLTAPGESVARQLPYYVLGTYRNDGRGNERATKVKLELRQGDKLLSEFASDALPPEQVAVVLLREVQRQLDSIHDDSVGQFDPAAEARQAFDRAKAFKLIGDFEEYCDLVEVALLLQPADVALQREAVQANSKQFEKFYRRDEKAPALEYYRRAAQLYQKVLEDDLNRPLEERTHSSIGYRLTTPAYDFENRNTKPPQRGLFFDVQDEIRKFLLQVCRLRMQGDWNNARNFLGAAVRCMPASAGYETAANTILELQDIAPSSKAIESYVFCFSMEDLNTAEGLQFLETLKLRGNDTTKKAVGTVEERVRYWRARSTQRAQVKPAVVDPTEQSPLGLKKLLLVDPESQQSFSIGSSYGVVPVAGLGDVIYHRTIYLLKQKDDLTTLWQPTDISDRISIACYDGRLIWAAVEPSGKHPYLLLIDPTTKRFRAIRPADGLPPVETSGGGAYTKNFALTAIGPGRVCVAASFGRTWIGVVTADLDSKPEFKLLHEARELMSERFDPEGWRSSKTAFPPTWMHSFQVGDEIRVLLGRGTAGPALTHCHPLVIDPNSGSVSVVQNEVRAFHFQGLTRHDITPSALFVCGSLNRAVPTSIVRLEFPNFEPEVVMLGTPRGTVKITDGFMHLIGDQWLIARFDGKEILDKRFTVVSEEVPWKGNFLFDSVHHSLNYGLIIDGYAPRELPKPDATALPPGDQD